MTAAAGQGDAAISSDAPPSEQCGEITAIVRDFRADHPDMEAFLGSLQGIVDEIGHSMDNTCQQLHSASEDAQERIIDEVAERNAVRW